MSGVNITSFGAIFLVAAAFIGLFRRRWLLPLLCVSAVLQSPSVIHLAAGEERYGVTPFMVAAALAALDFIARWTKHPGLRLDGPARRVLPWWIAFGAVSLAGAFVLPWLFAGTPVISPLDKAGALAAPVPLRWSVSNLAQVVNLALVSLAMLWLVQMRDEEDLPRRMFVGVVLAVVVSAAVGLQQRLAWNGLLPLWADFWTSNPTYAQNFQSLSGDVPRVNWPLVEPSYASAWFAAVLGGFLAMFLADVHRHKALAGAMVALFALGNTWGATGLLATGAFLVVALVVSLWVMAVHPRLRGGLGYRLLLAALVSTCVALGTWLVIRHYDMGELVATATDAALKGRRHTMLGDLRPLADLHGLVLLRDTWGLGVGMGSHRGSSWMVTLAANTGLIGLALFAIALVRQWHELVRLLPREPAASVLFFLGGSIAGIIAVAIAIPDQNWPVLWILLLGGLSCLLVEGDRRGPSAEQTQPTRRRKARDRAV